jgi:uncharacterized small protein (DUF1192 family)
VSGIGARNWLSMRYFGEKQRGGGMFQDEDQAKPKVRPFTLGQDVSAFAIAEIDETVARLRDEITRLEEVRAKKVATAQAADALFRKV